MSESIELIAGKQSLRLQSPIMNAAGTLGFADEGKDLLPLSELGAFITNPISTRSRSPARDSGISQYPGGFILHSGHPNLGLREVTKRYRERWLRMKPPIILHLIAQRVEEFEAMILALETEVAIAGIEIGVPEGDLDLVAQIARLAQQSELPAIIRMPLSAPAESFRQAALAGAPAFSLGPPRGRVPEPELGPMAGRMYGPSLFPLALEKLHQLRGLMEVPIIAAGGIVDQDQIQGLLGAGAAAVQLDSILWTRPEVLMESVRSS